MLSSECRHSSQRVFSRSSVVTTSLYLTAVKDKTTLWHFVNVLSLTFFGTPSQTLLASVRQNCCSFLSGHLLNNSTSTFSPEFHPSFQLSLTQLSLSPHSYRSILQLVKPWYDEVKDYSFPYPRDCNPRCPLRCYGPMCTHYTQVDA